jgi:hypothetical protein
MADVLTHAAASAVERPVRSYDGRTVAAVLLLAAALLIVVLSGVVSQGVDPDALAFANAYP